MAAVNKIYLVPLCACVIVPVTVTITYGLAHRYDHVTTFVPYISDIGTLSPESCIFSHLLNICAFLLLITFYIRHLHVAEFSRLHPSRGISPMKNRVASILGAVMCFGLGIVANYQETNLLVVHDVGVALCFLPAVVNFFIQSSLSRQMCPEACTKRMVIIRYLLASLCAGLVIILMTAALITKSLFTGLDYKNWTPEDGGYALHLVPAISEWLLVFCFCLFLLTYVSEFRRIIVYQPSISLPNFHADNNSVTDINYERQGIDFKITLDEWPDHAGTFTDITIVPTQSVNSSYVN